MVDSTKVLFPLFDKLRFWYRLIARAFSHLWTKCEILIRYRNEENDFIEAVHQTWVDEQRRYVHSLFHEGFKSSHWLLGLHYFFFIWKLKRRIFIASSLTEVLVLFTSLQNIIILSIIVILLASVKSTNVVCQHNWIYGLCIFVIFQKTGFVDIVRLCCKPSSCCNLYCLFRHKSSEPRCDISDLTRQQCI